MSRRWRMEDDEFLARYSGMDPDFLAFHDLHFTGKKAGSKRVSKLKALGVWDKIVAKHAAEDAATTAWVMAFGPEWAKEIAQDAAADHMFLETAA